MGVPAEVVVPLPEEDIFEGDRTYLMTSGLCGFSLRTAVEWLAREPGTLPYSPADDTGSAVQCR